jgi:acylphosphatase
MKKIQLIVSGRVQGVCFRASTQKQAEKLGINGFVKNNSNGSVEIVACAEQDILNKLVEWCHKGPLIAKVTSVIVNDFTSVEKFTQFDIL